MGAPACSNPCSMPTVTPCSTNSAGTAVVEDVATALEEMNAMLEVGGSVCLHNASIEAAGFLTCPIHRAWPHPRVHAWTATPTYHPDLLLVPGPAGAAGALGRWC